MTRPSRSESRLLVTLLHHFHAPRQVSENKAGFCYSAAGWAFRAHCPAGLVGLRLVAGGPWARLRNRHFRGAAPCLEVGPHETRCALEQRHRQHYCCGAINRGRAVVPICTSRCSECFCPDGSRLCFDKAATFERYPGHQGFGRQEGCRRLDASGELHAPTSQSRNETTAARVVPGRPSGKLAMRHASAVRQHCRRTGRTRRLPTSGIRIAECPMSS